MSKLTLQIANQLRAVYNGPNWTASCIKDQLSDVTWEQAITKVQDFNTIAVLSYHIHYYIHVGLDVLKGGPLVAKDIDSFDHPPITCQEEWEAFVAITFAEAEEYATLVENMDEALLWEPFANLNYGNYFRNIVGMIEHCHYHLGQIALLKKMTL